MTPIYRIKFGSRLYGTSTPTSDIDYMSIFIPDARSILLQRAKGAVNDQRPKRDGEKNAAGEVEEGRFSLQRYLSLLAEGQTVALDMLFAPSWAWMMEPSPIWVEIVDNRHRLLTKRSRAFIGYAMRQASKYGVRGSRVAASRLARDLLDRGISDHGASDKLEVMARAIEVAVGAEQHMAIVPQTKANGGVVMHWEVCGRKMPYTSSIKNARDIMQRLVDEYGQRALQAESNQGVDWKALSHAVRVGCEALELLRFGRITFPLPNAEHILAIKLGEFDYRTVADEIEALLPEIEHAAEESALPDDPDLEWVDDFVARVYRDAVLAS